MTSQRLGPLMWRKMNLSRDDIPSIGLTVIYEPEDSQTAAVDIVLVGGLGGHPVRTWFFPVNTASEIPASQAMSKEIVPTIQTGGLRGLIRTHSSRSAQSAKILVKRSTQRLRLDANINAYTNDGGVRPSLSGPWVGSAPSGKEILPTPQSVPILKRSPDTMMNHGTFWPLDLLPNVCPLTRIMVWGCHNIVMNGKLLQSQNSIFTHSEDLLHELTDFRDETNTPRRPVIFVAHSLGGIIVKELLRRADSEPEKRTRGLLESTLSVVFIGSPHRTSSAGSLITAVKNIAHLALGVDPDDPNISSLFEIPQTKVPRIEGEKLELGRSEFIRLWDDHNFHVRTFHEQESVEIEDDNAESGLRLRQKASFLEPPRENSEPLEGNHFSMAQFKSADSPGWSRFANVLQRLVQLELHKLCQITTRERECLEALEEGSLPKKEDSTISFHSGTCSWLYDITSFQDWHHRTARGRGRILWIKGPPGSGKSILLKNLQYKIEKKWAQCGGVSLNVAAEDHPFDAAYVPNPTRVYRTLLSRLFHHDPKLRRQLMFIYDHNLVLEDAAVMSFFVEDYIQHQVEVLPKRTFIFVDTADSCKSEYLQELLIYLAQLAKNSDLSIAVASVEQADVVLPNSSGIKIQTPSYNNNEILRFLSLKLEYKWEESNKTVQRVVEKSRGIFLWAELVINIINTAIKEGAKPKLIDHTVELIPDTLDGLYEWLLLTLVAEEKAEALMLFQWVLLASEPLRLNDLRFAMQVSKSWPHFSLMPELALRVGNLHSIYEMRRLQESQFDSPHRFYRWVRQRSLGLLELRPGPNAGNSRVEFESIGGQRVQTIHDSVHSFFLYGRGYAILAEIGTEISIPFFRDISHYSLLNACLTYLSMGDFEPLSYVFHFHGNSSTSSDSQKKRHEPRSTKLLIQPKPLSYEESEYWRRVVSNQRKLFMSSYPFLQYSTYNILYHFLSPRKSRYFPPLADLLNMFSKDKCRLWKVWTSLLGTTDPSQILLLSKSASHLSTKTSGASFRLEKVFRRLNRLVHDEMKMVTCGIRRYNEIAVDTKQELNCFRHTKGRQNIGKMDFFENSPVNTVVMGRDESNCNADMNQENVENPTLGRAVTTNESIPSLHSPYLNWHAYPSRRQIDTATEYEEAKLIESSLERFTSYGEVMQLKRTVPVSKINLVAVSRSPKLQVGSKNSILPPLEVSVDNENDTMSEPHTVTGNGTGIGVGMRDINESSREISSFRTKLRKPSHTSQKASQERFHWLLFPVDSKPRPVTEIGLNKRLRISGRDASEIVSSKADLEADKDFIGTRTEIPWLPTSHMQTRDSRSQGGSRLHHGQNQALHLLYQASGSSLTMPTIRGSDSTSTELLNNKHTIQVNSKESLLGRYRIGQMSASDYLVPLSHAFKKSRERIWSGSMRTKTWKSSLSPKASETRFQSGYQSGIEG